MIIGISGLAGSGKDTAADFLVKHAGFVRIGLADKIKRICKDVFDFTDEQLWGPSSSRNAPDTRYKRAECPECGGKEPESKKCEGPGVTFLTPRYALQQLGTEWGRDCYSDVWVEDAMRTAKTLLSDDDDSIYHYDMKLGLTRCTSSKPCILTAKGVVISDVRFKNEMAGIKRAGGFLIRMKRGTGLTDGSAVHPSEAEQLEVPDEFFDAVIHNESISLEELQQQVMKVFRSLC